MGRRLGFRLRGLAAARAGPARARRLRRRLGNLRRLGLGRRFAGGACGRRALGRRRFFARLLRRLGTPRRRRLVDERRQLRPELRPDLRAQGADRARLEVDLAHDARVLAVGERERRRDLAALARDLAVQHRGQVEPPGEPDALLRAVVRADLQRLAGTQRHQGQRRLLAQRRQGGAAHRLRALAAESQHQQAPRDDDVGWGGGIGGTELRGDLRRVTGSRPPRLFPLGPRVRRTTRQRQDHRSQRDEQDQCGRPSHRQLRRRPRARVGAPGAGEEGFGASRSLMLS